MRLTLVFTSVLLVTSTGVPMHSFSSSPVGIASRDQNPLRVTIPAGTRILVRTDQAIDSRRSRAGSRFTGTLETNVQLDNLTVAPRGATVHGRITEARRAGSRSGGATLSLELTDIIINGTANPILTQSFDLRTQGRGGRTARRTFRGAGLGALVGSVAGGGAGAGIGAAVGGGTGLALSGAGGGRQIEIPGESLLEFRLAQPASLQVAR